MGEIVQHVLAVLPAFLLACLAVAALAVPRRDTPPAGTRPGRDPGGARHRPGRRVPLSRPGRAQRDAGGYRQSQAGAAASSRSRRRETLPVAPRGSSGTRQNSVGTLGRGSAAEHAARSVSARSGPAGSVAGIT